MGCSRGYKKGDMEWRLCFVEGARRDGTVMRVLGLANQER